MVNIFVVGLLSVGALLGTVFSSLLFLLFTLVTLSSPVAFNAVISW